MNPETLTPAQARILASICRAFIAECTWPTVRELAAEHDMNVNGIAGHLKALTRKGFLDRPSGAPARCNRIAGVTQAENPKAYVLSLLEQLQ